MAYYKVPDPKKTKLGPRALKSVFVGYAENSKAYRLLDLDSNVVVESRDVEFFESKFRKDSIPTNELVQEPHITVPNDSSSNHIRPTDSGEIRRSTRARKEKTFGPDFINSQAISFLVEGNREVVTNKIPIIFNVEDEDDPRTFKEAMTSRNSAFWKEAVNNEMESLIANGT